MILFKDSIFLHSPKTGGTFIKSWMYNNVRDHTKFCQPIVPECLYSLEDLNCVRSALNQKAKDEFDICMEEYSLDHIFVKIQHISLEHLDPSFTEGKKIFFFVRDPIDWIYSKIKYGVQIGVFKTIEKALQRELGGNTHWHLDNLKYLDEHNADVFMMKYECLYYNIIKMLELSNMPLTNDVIKTLIVKDKTNPSLVDNGHLNRVCRIDHLEQILSQFDNRIFDFYQNPEVAFKKIKNFEKPLAK